MAGTMTASTPESKTATVLVTWANGDDMDEVWGAFETWVANKKPTALLHISAPWQSDDDEFHIAVVYDPNA